MIPWHGRTAYTGGVEMTTTTKEMKMFRIQEGFGDLANIEECWDVKSMLCEFADEESAKEFADLRYEAKVKKLMSTMPDWYKSYWVRVIPV